MRTSSILLGGLLLLPSTLGCAGPGDRSAAIATDDIGISLVNAVFTDNYANVDFQDPDSSLVAAGALQVQGSSEVSIAYSAFNGNGTNTGNQVHVDGEDILTSVLGSDGNVDSEPSYADCCGGDPQEWDLHLASGSALIDAGDPSIEDADGSTSDMGAYGGPGGEW